MKTDDQTIAKRTALNTAFGLALAYAAYLLCFVYPHLFVGSMLAVGAAGMLFVILDGDIGQATRRKQLLKDLYEEQPCRLTDEERELIAELIEGKNH